MSNDAMYLLLSSVPRGGPGSDACTAEALARIPPIPASAKVLDLGCGSGWQTLVLARTLCAKIIAIDHHLPSLDKLRASAVAEGVESLIEIRHADFASLDVPPGSIDLVWSEGAAYVLGFEESLSRWRPFLREG